MIRLDAPILILADLAVVVLAFLVLSSREGYPWVFALLLAVALGAFAFVTRRTVASLRSTWGAAASLEDTDSRDQDSRDTDLRAHDPRSGR